MLTVGKTYMMSGIHVRCVGFTKKGYAKMQTLGMTAGGRPNSKDISQYSKVTQDFTDEWEGVTRKFRLPTAKKRIIDGYVSKTQADDASESDE